MGNIERPKWYRFEFREDPQKHMVLLDANVLSSRDLFNEFSRQLSRRAQVKAFVFVHGYNVSFEDAALRTAQMAFDLNFSGLPVFYSWPSHGKLETYTYDETNVEWAEANLRSFFRTLAAESGAQEIYVIAHSMGARAATRALLALLKEQPSLAKTYRELILAAPDIDADVFRRDIVPGFAALAHPVTMYASSNDKALRVSKGIHARVPRAGDSGHLVVVERGLETIDATAIDTDFLGHSYYADTRVLLTDISLLLEQRMRAQKRPGLQTIKRDPVPYWQFRK
jgi:esterase/lipase superfamily enzyme